MSKVFIIAEAGVNHNGDLELAKKLVDVALDAGSDAIKFQTFIAEKIVTKTTPKAAYQAKNTGKDESQYEMLKKLELSPDDHRQLTRYCSDQGIIFMSTPFDKGSVDLLNSLGMQIFKIPSGEITNMPYLKKVGGLQKRVIMSTGMADLHEIGDAIHTLVASGTKKSDITVLHCSTEYPVPPKRVNLLAMLTIRDTFDVEVGYSDHTRGIEVAIAAAALGASVIEKHLTLDKKMEGPDHKASLEPGELKIMVRAIRNIEKALGKPIKKPTKSELKNRAIVRRSIVAARNIKKGERFTERNITAKRPGTGISPFQWDCVVGKIAVRSFEKDELIEI